MSDKRYVVPEGMLKVAEKSYATFGHDVEDMVEATLRWLAENPIVPPQDWQRRMSADWKENPTAHKIHPDVYTQIGDGAVEWQRIMFKAAEPEIPEELKNLMAVVVDLPNISTVDANLHNSRIIEAYRLGQKAGSK